MEEHNSNISGVKTFFASAEREDVLRIKEQREMIEASEFLNIVMSRTPWMFVILNDKRQIIYSNARMVNFLGFENLDELIGFRPGEVIGCVHANEGPGGCGTSRNCAYCGVVRTILKSSSSSKAVTEDAVISYFHNGSQVNNEFTVTSVPFVWKEQHLSMVTFQDISSIKRKEQLERIFFHDILNKAGTISHLMNLLKEREPSLIESNLFELLDRGVDEFIQDIVYQQKLQQAETGKLEVNLVEISVDIVIKTVIEDYSVQTLMQNIKVQKEIPEQEQFIISDIVLLRRILGNLLKNAIEATSKGETITISFFTDESHATFRVSNPAVIPANIRSHIFARSISTKGTGRGLGTYSIKLFAEQYLNGRAWFTSEDGKGTDFYVSFPLSGN